MNATRPGPERSDLGFWRSLVSRLRWRDRTFYPLFDMHVQLGVDSVTALLELLADVRDPKGRVREIEALEKRADSLVKEVQVALRGSILPPYPRAAIVDLVNHLDDILDICEDAAQTIHLYHVTQITPDAIRLAQLALDSVKQLQIALKLLAVPERAREILVLCASVDDMEAQADHVMRSAISKLFREEPDARELIKLRAVYEVLEELTDVCKDVAAELEAIVLGRIGP
jgi:uncharacterized protein